MIDVGANIGDTVMLCADAPDARFLCVEADPKFAPILRHNLTGVNAVFIHSLCGARDETVGVVRQNQEGTAIFAPAGSAGAGEQVAFRRLDSIIDEHPDFAAAHLLKIDTDGYDFDVLRGATRMLARRPAVFFEAAPFGRKSYLTEVGAIFDLLRTSGYTQVLLYDNYGLPFGRYRLADEAAWTDALRYQVFSGRIFYDILAMGDPDFDEFAATEYGFFDTKHASQMAPSAT